MQIPCPSCNHPAEQSGPPIRGPGGGELWVCIECPAVICSHPVFSSPDASEACYIKHTREAHPELYQAKRQPSGGHKKNKKGKKR